MDRLISEQAVLDVLNKAIRLGRFYCGKNQTIKEIKDIPSAESKTGHWEHLRCDMYKCSKCQYIYTDLSGEKQGMNYCPNCGARIIDTQEESEEQV